MNGAETWDVVERGPNFMLPAALVYLIYKAREDRAAEGPPAPASGELGGPGVGSPTAA
jgi:hypothetical protein